MKVEKITNTFLNNTFYQKDRWQQLRDYQQTLKKNGCKVKQNKSLKEDKSK